MKFTVSALIGLFLSTTLISQVRISNNFPTQVKGGSNNDVEVKIEKMGIANFAKYQMDVPVGVTVTEVDSKTGNFTFENNRAKIVWVSIPTDGEITVKFKISVPGSLASPAYITQKFFYLDNGSKKEVDAEAISFTVTEGAVAVTPPKKEEPMSLHNSAKKGKAKMDTVTGIYKPEPVTKKEETAKTETKKTEPNLPAGKAGKEEPVKKQEVAKVETPKTEPKKEEPVKKSEPIAGTIYRIQLAAGASDPGKAKYAAAGDVEVVKEGGMFKVLTGNCATKEEALKLREQLIAKGLTGFVVAYNNGVRVK